MSDEVKNKHVYLCIQCGYSADALIRKYSKSTVTLQSCVSFKTFQTFRMVYSSLVIDDIYSASKLETLSSFAFLGESRFIFRSLWMTGRIPQPHLTPLCLLQENCKEVVDKYIEYDLTAVFIDILLLKISAYRHFIFNAEDKGYLKRILMLSLFFHSYVEWVYEKHRTHRSDSKSAEPIFYELEWGYYQMCIQQLLNAVVFTAMFLFNAFLVSKSFVKIPEYFSYRRMLDGVAISYCWNLVVIPSLVWNHYDTYSILSQIALLISSIHTFRVCVSPGYFLSISSTLGCFAMRQSTSHFLRLHFVSDSWMAFQPNENASLQSGLKLLLNRSQNKVQSFPSSTLISFGDYFKKFYQFQQLCVFSINPFN